MPVLYFFPGDVASERAADLARECYGIKCVDVSITDRLPSYVDGVPILADDHEEFRGTNCLRRLEELTGESGDGGVGFCPDESTAASVSDLMFSGKKEFLKGSLGGDTLSRYMQARQKEIAEFQPRRRK